MARRRTAAVVSLGCSKNLVDTEYLVGGLGAGGWGVVPETEDADLLLVNTCSFIGPAVEESHGAIADALAWKAKRRGRTVVVAGCMVSRFGAGELEAAHPGVDLFLLPGQIPQLGAWLAHAAPRPTRLARGGRAFLPGGGLERGLTTGPFAYLKISDGCSNRCSYCLIPLIRGPHRSRARAAVLEEARALVAAGVAELDLVGQDITRYGARQRGGLAALVRAVAALPGDFRVRLLYLHPDRVGEAVFDLLAETPRLCPYLDMPIQHASSRVLECMGRRYDRRELARRIDTARRRVPGIALRTTVMVGHPGEGPREFRELLSFLADHPFENLGAFTFSPQPGTRSASLSGAASAEEAAERLRSLMEQQASVSARLWAARRGRETEALVEAALPGRAPAWTGRTLWQAPEVDGRITLRGPAVPGRWTRVRVTGSSTYDLEGLTL